MVRLQEVERDPMSNVQQIRKYLSVIRRACDLLELQLDEDTSDFEAIVEDVQGARKPAEMAPSKEKSNEEEERKCQHKKDRAKHIESLLAIDCWPVAVPEHYSNTKPTESDNINRANAILDMCLPANIEGKTFLDYGCGDGYIASQIILRGAQSVTGYDIAASDCWEKLGSDKVVYTSDTGTLKKGSYDIIFLYDVLDHAVDPVGIMAHIKYLTAAAATVYVRCHPWTSRHASHLPKIGLNKAYIHLFLTYEEIVDLGFQPMFTRIEKDPQEAYRWWFKDFRVTKEKPIKLWVDDFFRVPAFKDLLAMEQQLDPNGVDRFLDLMEINFIDYVLEA